MSKLKNMDYFKSVLELDFNIFQFVEDIGRKHALPYLIMHLLDSLPTREENYGSLNE
jgi:hypothetical protein